MFCRARWRSCYEKSRDLSRTEWRSADDPVSPCRNPFCPMSRPLNLPPEVIWWMVFLQLSHLWQARKPSSTAQPPPFLPPSPPCIFFYPTPCPCRLPTASPHFCTVSSLHIYICVLSSMGPGWWPSILSMDFRSSGPLLGLWFCGVGRASTVGIYIPFCVLCAMASCSYHLSPPHLQKQEESLRGPFAKGKIQIVKNPLMLSHYLFRFCKFSDILSLKSSFFTASFRPEKMSVWQFPVKTSKEETKLTHSPDDSRCCLLAGGQELLLCTLMYEWVHIVIIVMESFDHIWEDLSHPSLNPVIKKDLCTHWVWSQKLLWNRTAEKSVPHPR